jgi:hypothetical protein
MITTRYFVILTRNFMITTRYFVIVIRNFMIEARNFVYHNIIPIFAAEHSILVPAISISLLFVFPLSPSLLHLVASLLHDKASRPTKDHSLHHTQNIFKGSQLKLE